MCISVGYVHLSARAFGSQRHWISLELKLQVMSCRQVLGTQLREQYILITSESSLHFSH